MSAAAGPGSDATSNPSLSRRRLAAGVVGVGAALATGSVVSEGLTDAARAAGPSPRRPTSMAAPAALSGGSANGTTGLLLLEPGNDTTDGIIIVEPDATYGDRGGEPYGEGQPIILYKQGSGAPNQQVLFRVDAYGGIGTADGIHVATGLNQDPGYSANYGVSIETTRHDAIGLNVTQNASPSHNAIQVVNPSGQVLVAIDKTARLLVSAPDGVAREIGVQDQSGTVRAALYSGSGAYGARAIFSCGTDDVTPALVIGSGAGQTKDLFDVQNDGTTWLKVTSSGEVVAAGDASVAGAGHTLGFYGAPPVSQPSPPTPVIATPATNLAPYGYTTAEQANALVDAVNVLINVLSEAKGGCGITA